MVPIPVFYYAARRARCGLGAYTPPVAGPVSSPFGIRPQPIAGATTDHQGIDYGVPVGTPVTAPAPGVVIFAGVQSGFGNVVQVDHGGGQIATYGHLSQIMVSVGQAVAPGDLLGLSGATGTVTGPNLHFQVDVAGVPVDPAGWLAAGVLPSVSAMSAVSGGVPTLPTFPAEDPAGAGVDPVLAGVVAAVTGLALAVALS
jgi:murein DD-endopeptidase MepM/ murein hydrolase activator NlpD